MPEQPESSLSADSGGCVRQLRFEFASVARESAPDARRFADRARVERASIELAAAA
jgi:hypothetical protein